MNPPTYFLYARKSTDEDDRQILSIESQLTELREFARKERLTIANEFIESRSAKVPGRPIFNRMMALAEGQKPAGLLAWHPDRLARNSVDGGRIVYLLDTGKLSSLKFPTFWFENTPQGKFMLTIAFGQSKYYVDNLIENIWRGLRHKFHQGEFPGKPPVGYLNESRLRTIVVAPIATKSNGYPATAPLARQMLKQIETWKETEAQASGAAALPLKAKLAALETKLERLLDAHLEGLISREEYTRRKERPLLEKSRLSARLAAVERRGNHWLEPLARFVRTAPSRSLTGSGNPAHSVAFTDNLDSLKEWTIRIGSNRRLARPPRACEVSRHVIGLGARVDHLKPSSLPYYPWRLVAVRGRNELVVPTGFEPVSEP